MEMKKLIPAVLPGGFRDYGPEEMMARNKMFRVIADTYERFGFVPIDTPDVELLATLVDEGAGKRIYELNKVAGWNPVSSEDGQRIASRFDLTVPLARFFAANISTLPKPFKRWQTGRVRRGEKPQAGRYCEFMQCDIDTVGTDSPLADAEIMWVMYETLLALGVGRFRIHLNHRGVLNGLAQIAGFENRVVEVLRILDKMDKIGIDQVLRSLSDPTENSDEEIMDDDAIPNYGLGLEKSVVDIIQKFLEIKGTPLEVIEALRSFGGYNPLMNKSVDDLHSIMEYLTAVGLPVDSWGIDLTVVRGLGYYTGPVFETTLLDLPKIGSVFSGGRYDGLVGRFLPNEVPATGASIGIDRLFEALKILGRIKTRRSPADVYVTVMDPSRINDYLKIVAKLREAGINTLLHMGNDSSFRAQLAMATSQEIPVVIICGSNEFEGGTITLKDMAQRKQYTVPHTDMVAMVQSILA